MTVEDIVHSPANRARARQAPVGPHIDNILTALEPLGYKSRSLLDLAYGLIQFGEYLRRQGLGDLSQLRFHHVEAFVATQPLRQCRTRYRYPISRGVWAARQLWRYACATGRPRRHYSARRSQTKLAPTGYLGMAGSPVRLCAVERLHCRSPTTAMRLPSHNRELNIIEVMWSST